MMIDEPHPTAPTAFPLPDLRTDEPFASLLAESYERLLGRPMAERTDAAFLYRSAPFCLLAHGLGDDPRFIYANERAQSCFGYDWQRFVGLPSRLSAEAPDRAERQRLLDGVARQGFVADYRGIRVARSGRRFWIENVVVWNLTDRTGEHYGQAALFHSWRDL